MKTCSKCGVPKTEAEFQRRADNGRLRNDCKKCSVSKQVEHRLLNPEERRESDRRYREAHATEILERARAFAKLNRAELLQKRRARYKSDPGVSLKSNAKWNQLNPEKVRASKRRRHQERYNTDPRYKAECVLRARLLQALRADKAKKTASTFSLLGCPMVWLEVHLESLFKPGMTWENHGPVWHIDHIKPCAAFDLRDPEQQKACFHWTNLQPLWAEENRRKGAAV